LTKESSSTVDIEQVLDKLPLQGKPLQVAITMALVLIVDGFDILLLAYVAPAVVKDFGLTSGGLGAVLTASLIGVAAGGFLGGYLGDRFGRRTIINASLLVFGFATLLSAVTENIVIFSVARLIVGLGLGAATPNAAALMSEVLPGAWRNQIITIAYASSTLGTTFAGILSRQMLDDWGWRGLFIAGAVLPLFVCLVLMPLIPESPRFLARAKYGGARVAKALNDLLGEKVYTGSEDFKHVDTGSSSGKMANLVSIEFRRDTLSLGGMIFMILFAWVAIGNWGTTIITSLGYDLTSAVSVMVGYNLAGLFGAVFTAFVMSRFGSRRIFTLLSIIAVLASLVFAGALNTGQLSLFWITIYILIAGATLTALLQASYPVAAHVFPTSIRATGVGSVFGFGRLGAVSSSAVTAGLIIAGGPALVFVGVGITATGILIGVRSLQRHIPPDQHT
jgi:MFS transporter, AAHS family, 4-hydroxybenzoate transporter